MLLVASVDESKQRGRPRKFKAMENEDTDLEAVTENERICKAGNPNCGLLIGESLALGPIGVMPCDICCSEPEFCRECLCILCGKTMKCGFSAYTSVRCCVRSSGAEFCGHAAHLMCALECHLAGVIKPLGLDMEYICRRCDRKTDLREHVVRLLDSLRYTNCRFTVERNLGTALQIMQGTQDSGAKRLVYLVQTAINMVCKGSQLGDVFDLLNGAQPQPLLD